MIMYFSMALLVFIGSIIWHKYYDIADADINIIGIYFGGALLWPVILIIAIFGLLFNLIARWVNH